MTLNRPFDPTFPFKKIPTFNITVSTRFQNEKHQHKTIKTANKYAEQ